MDYYVNLFIQSFFVENLALAFFLGMCTFLAVSKNINTAFGLGMTVLVVMVIAIPPQQPDLPPYPASREYLPRGV